MGLRIDLNNFTGFPMIRQLAEGMTEGDLINSSNIIIKKINGMKINELLFVSTAKPNQNPEKTKVILFLNL